MVADVAYDLFTSSTAAGDEEFEIMIWLAAVGGAGPISSTYVIRPLISCVSEWLTWLGQGADGNPTPIATIRLAGHDFNLFKGPNGQMTVFSFLPAGQITNFNADLKDFFDYLVAEQNLDESQYLISAGAGTEAFTGTNAVFTVSDFSVEIV